MRGFYAAAYAESFGSAPSRPTINLAQRRRVPIDLTVHGSRAADAALAETP